MIFHIFSILVYLQFLVSDCGKVLLKKSEIRCIDHADVSY